MTDAPVPPGWPPGVPPHGADGFEEAAVAWLLDHCPPDHRLHPVWRRHPAALAWIARRHIAGQVDAMRDAYRVARVELGDRLPPEGVHDVLEALAAEGLRLRAAAHAADLLVQAFEGRRYVPRL